MTQYVDTSILAAYYCPEPLSERAEERLLDWAPETPIDEGLERFADWVTDYDADRPVLEV